MQNSQKHKRDFTLFHDQAFLHDLSNFEWEHISLLDDVELAWNLFHSEFLKLISKHAPLRQFRIKGRNNRWFSTEIGNLLKERDLAWARARKTKTGADWIIFHQLRIKCTPLIKKAKSEFCLSETTKNLKEPRKFWTVVRSASGAISSTEFSDKDSVNLTDKCAMLNYLNEHFITAGHLFDSFNSDLKSHALTDEPSVVNRPPVDYSFNVTFYVLINLVFSFFVRFSGFWSCFFPCHLVSLKSPVSVPQLHLITNHFPTVFSFQFQSHSLRNPHFT